MKHALTALLPLCPLLTSCVIYLDDPHEETISGRVLYKDGTPAQDALVHLRSPRDYVSFPPLSHDPWSIKASGVTNKEGYYSITMNISRPPYAFITAGSSDTLPPKYFGRSNAPKNATIILMTEAEHLDYKQSAKN